MTLTAEQIKKALTLPADEMVAASLRKIQRGEMTFSDMQELCAMRMGEDETIESVAKDLGLIQ